MNENKFKTFMLAAKNIGGDYARGYQQGLRRFYHGANFGTENEHDKYMSLGLNGDPRTEIGEGYRTAVDGKPPRGIHGNLGNLNAQVGLPADAQLQCRLNSQIKSRFVKQAQRENMKLTPWVLKTLLDACEE